ncbi:MAG: T9SS type A sorting domain-containing protein [Flavobacteriales bacterium]|nr:T9SS type A sorting domain-containing protein [Flavobacteriales bacterium]
MKKAYLILFSLATVTVFGQQRPTSAPNATYMGEELPVNDANEYDDCAAPNAQHSRHTGMAVQRGGYLWHEDFGNGFPAGWAIDDISGICPWKWTTNGSHGYWNGNNAADYADPISSTTASNGFLICDPDSANHFTYGQPSGSTYQYLESYFATNKIDLGASYPSLLLEFEQSFRFNNSVDMEVQVSVDSTNWTTYTVQGSVNNNTASDDPDIVSLNISGTVGNSPSFYLRIGWNARVYFWMIDDMRVVEGYTNDLAMTEVWHGDISNAFEYQKIPLSQVQEVVIGAACVNQGGVPQTNAVYSYDINDGSSSVASGTFSASTASIASVARDTTWYSTGFTPSAVGTYTVTVSVAADSTDEVMSNNEMTSTFDVTDFIYGHDDENNIQFQVSGGEDNNMDANEYKIALYYEIVQDVTLTAVQTAFGSNTTTSSCIIEVFDAINNQSLDDPLITEVYDLQAGDVSSSGAPDLVNMPLDGGNGVELPAGVYLISIGNTGVGEDLWFLASDGDDDRAQLRYGPFGSGGAINWYTGYTTSPIIRANFDPSVGIRENEDVTAVQIYPNPVTDNLTVRFEAKDDQDLTIRVLNVAGEIVLSSQSKTKAGQRITKNFNVQNLAAGVYMVQIQGATSSFTKRVVVQ